jgi:hypothetical protein
MALVVDASIALAWALPDESSTYADAVLAVVERDGVRVPSLWAREVANGLERFSNSRGVADLVHVGFFLRKKPLWSIGFALLLGEPLLLSPISASASHPLMKAHF